MSEIICNRNSINSNEFKNEVIVSDHLAWWTKVAPRVLFTIEIEPQQVKTLINPIIPYV